MSGEYYKTKKSVNEYIKLAKNVNGSQLINKLHQFFSSNSLLLEMGSGPGTDWEILNETHNVIGSDNSIEFLKHLMNEYPQGEFIELDATSIRTNRRFDGIYSNKVLHHLRHNELLDSIKRQHEVLNLNGIICHSFWNGEGFEIFKGLFINYHTKTNLKDFFNDYFEILLIECYKEFEEGDSILLIAKKI